MCEINKYLHYVGIFITFALLFVGINKKPKTKMLSTKPKFVIPPKYRHVINDIDEAQAKCAEIWGEFSKNRYLQALLKMRDKFVEFCQKSDTQNVITEDYFPLIEKNWEIILAYYALSDNQESPFQQFKEDNSQKTRVVFDTLGISPLIAAMIDRVEEDLRINEDAEAIIFNCFVEQIRMPYISTVCSNEWSYILGLQDIIHSSNLKLRKSNANVKPEHEIKVENEKHVLIEKIDLQRNKLEDKLATLYGKGNYMITEAQRYLNIQTVYSRHVLIEKNITDIGQNIIDI